MLDAPFQSGWNGSARPFSKERRGAEPSDACVVGWDSRRPSPEATPGPVCRRPCPRRACWFYRAQRLTDATVDGQRESEASWTAPSLDAVGRRLNGRPSWPWRAWGSGGRRLSSFLKGHQRCLVHKTANLLDKLPKGQQPATKAVLHEVWMAGTNQSLRPLRRNLWRQPRGWGEWPWHSSSFRAQKGWRKLSGSEKLTCPRSLYQAL